ncbi:hypothetical protein TREMEDRAFT_58363 [Tremella mesenterica DSM 1558]|uniref:uncharacterized protein n=1 Tax=Tremella mesenterica (strain ATCC 24925 / CBS 8224 / DSM 1558 / NBRC 9311 / NRRL Y-6157 / RJB 2259-6 / UBC 559-6) TaxID=578456 RepID=UPI0003F49960|nr:uncharacterized protein TREMEDRAFT_58363 [Tremella mesenterica DSM 1558]EIW72208.1 hypothetical protein TREMEDRAFT_58363 [Tremella mesenterica DSM 1558]
MAKFLKEPEESQSQGMVTCRSIRSLTSELEAAAKKWKEGEEEDDPVDVMGRRGEEERMDIDVIGERGEKGSTDHRLWGDTEVNVISFEILEGESQTPLSFQYVKTQAVETQRERFEEASGVLTNQLAKMKHGLSAFLERINSPTTRITQACAIQEEQANGIVWDLRSLLLQVEHAGAQVVPGFVPSLPLREPPADAPPPMDLQALVYLTNVITKVSGSPVDEIDSLD